MVNEFHANLFLLHYTAFMGSTSQRQYYFIREWTMLFPEEMPGLDITADCC